jgi:hypothetical protein
MKPEENLRVLRPHYIGITESFRVFFVAFMHVADRANFLITKIKAQCQKVF